MIVVFARISSLVAVTLVIFFSGCTKETELVPTIRIFPVAHVIEPRQFGFLNDKIKRFVDRLQSSGYKEFYGANYMNRGKEHYIFLYAKSDSECHGCGTTVAGVVFTRESSDGRYVDNLKFKSDNIVNASGSWGKPPEATLVAIGKNDYAILLEGGVSTMGESFDHVNIVVLGDTGFISAFETATHWDDSGKGGDKYSEYSVGIDIIPSSKKYYDIMFEYQGNASYLDGLNPKIINSIKGTKKSVFVYDNGKYL
jgi:hypothetical protein